MGTLFKVTEADMNIIMQKVANILCSSLDFYVKAHAPDWSVCVFELCIMSGKAESLGKSEGLRYTIDWEVQVFSEDDFAEGVQTSGACHSVIPAPRFVTDIKAVRVAMGNLSDATSFRNAIALELASRMQATALRELDYSLEARVTRNALYIQVDNQSVDAEGFIA